MMFSALQRSARWALATVIITAGAGTVVPAAVRAQQPKPQRPAPTPQTPRRQATIEIRGQVPTPQVVTVRPRETPAYSRRVLVPTFFDHDFWPSILPPLQIVSPAGGAVPTDSASRAPADSAARVRLVLPRPPLGTPPAPLRR